MKAAIALSVLLGLSSCSSPPKPPSADGHRRRPVNAAAEVEWQRCRSQLTAAHILVAEGRMDVAGLTAELARVTSTKSRAPGDTDDLRSRIYTVLFPFGATKVDLNVPGMKALYSDAKTSPLIILSGRTDGTRETAAESRVARMRVEFVLQALTSIGIPAARIRTTWQSVGDQIASNNTPSGRALNRRVEIEVYREAPYRVDPMAVATPQS